MTLDLEQLAAEVQAEHRARFRDVKTQPVSHVEHPAPVIPTCSRCGAAHDRYRDAAHTRPASYCGPCAADYARGYMRTRRTASRSAP
jgi:hypothetical protein